MKLILSRKGFDSASGGVANPILPDGQLCPLPIPDRRSTLCYQDIRTCRGPLPQRYHQLGALVADLTNGKINPTDGCHLDPDLEANSTLRASGWRPAFGQAGAAQGHLQNQSIGAGDLFLFYGWFRRTEFVDGRLRYVANAPDLHLIYGWLQVARVVYPDHAANSQDAVPGWLRNHPHCAPDYARQNAIYISRQQLSLPGVAQAAESTSIPGSGRFATPHPARQLTAAGNRLRSLWRLPRWFYPQQPRQALSYHGDMRRWQLNDDHALLKTVGRGQEFVLDGAQYAECSAWLHELLER